MLWWKPFQSFEFYQLRFVKNGPFCVTRCTSIGSFMTFVGYACPQNTRINHSLCKNLILKEYDKILAYEMNEKFIHAHAHIMIKNTATGPALRKFYVISVPASVGAVALPDGRVIICGGVLIELVQGGRVCTFHQELMTPTRCIYSVL